MSRQVLLDTGPLVALINPADDNHERCSTAAKSLPTTLLTSWPVLTEAAYLLRRRSDHVRELLRYPDEGLLQCLPLPADFPSWAISFFDKYSDREPQLADASLVYLAEQEGVDMIFTLDQRDFLVYRLTGDRAVTIVPSPQG